jgi:hypothetical protein
MSEKELIVRLVTHAECDEGNVNIVDAIVYLQMLTYMVRSMNR